MLRSIIVKSVRLVYGLVLRVLEQTVLTDRNKFYERYFATNNHGVLFLKNFLEPRRFLTKLRYGQICALPRVVRPKNYIPRNLLGKDVTLREIPASPTEDLVRKLNSDGIIIINEWNKPLAQSIAEKFNIFQSQFSSSIGYIQQTINPFLYGDLFDLCTNNHILTIIARYYDAQPYLRSLPGFSIAYPSFELDYSGRFFEKNASLLLHKKYNIDWHYDTPNQVTAHLLLTDTTLSDTRMLVAKGSHRSHHQYLSGEWDYYYSEEFVRDKYDLVECIGNMGTLIIFDSNAIHRMEPVKDSFRAHVHLNFTPGNDIVTDNTRLNRGRLISIEMPEVKDKTIPDIGLLPNLKRNAVEHFLVKPPHSRQPSATSISMSSSME